MDDESSGGAEEDAGKPADAADGEASPADEIVDLPWDDDLPVALGEETPTGVQGEPVGSPDDLAASEMGADAALDDGDGDDAEDGAEDLGELSEHDRVGGRRNSLPRRVESWRSRSATGAIATAIAMGLQQVFEPERRRPAAVAEAPSDPYSDDDPITVDYVPDDAEATTVHVKPWLLEKGEPG